LEAAERAGRLAREIEHHRRIAERAEILWTWDSLVGRRRADRRAEFFVRGGALGPGRRALELGCGTGVFLERVAASGAAICGLDLSTDLLERAARRVSGHAQIRLCRGDAGRLPFPPGSFDVVYGSSVLHHLDLEETMTEVFRVLRPGGRAVFAEPNLLNPQIVAMFKLNLLKKRYAVSPDEMAFTRFRAARTLRRIGFEDVSVVPFDFLHPSVPASWIDGVSRIGRRLERVPLIREIAGSLVIRAAKHERDG
jgi:ubiquinone/menaquinone biosynthesis C-methylase UbiE